LLYPGENVSFTVWYHITAKPRTMPNISENGSYELVDIPPALVSEYTQEEGPWQTSNPTLGQLAVNLTGSETKVLTILKNFIVWIKEHISYPNPKTPHENPYYPIKTYDKREGDCDDQAMLLIALSRIVGIPAYLQIGCIYLPNRFDNDTFWDDHVFLSQKRIGWHGWAIVYVPPWGWLPLDLTYVTVSDWVKKDPLNAIKHGAITSQSTVQYMNVTHTDYVASSFETRAFLIENEFNVYMEDELTLDADPSPFTIGINPWFPLVFTASAAVFIVLASFMISRRYRKRIAKEKTTIAKVHE
jgi:uncharacterized membrane protein YhdT